MNNGSLLGSQSFARLLVAFDGSDGALKACEVAAVMAKTLGSEVLLLYAIPPLGIYTAPLGDEYYAIQEEKAAELTGNGVAVFKKQGVEVRIVVLRARWSIPETIIDHSEDYHADLIILGARGMGGFEELLIGSVSGAVVAHARCPVMIVK